MKLKFNFNFENENDSHFRAELSKPCDLVLKTRLQHNENYVS